MPISSTGATQTSVDNVAAAQAVPTADVVTNTSERDVIGNKTDAAVTVVGTTKSVIAYLKGILNRMPTSGTVAVVTDVTSGPTAAAADSVNVALQSETIGNKADAAVTTVGTTKSVIAYLKGILNRLPTSGTVAVVTDVQAGATVAVADAVTNTADRDVIGNKTDAAVTTVGTTKSVIAYLKGILNRMPTSGTVAIATDVTSGPTAAAADSVNVALASETIGNKADAAVTTVGTTKSVIAYLKGILNRMPTSGTVAVVTDVQAGATVAVADAVTNTADRDVIGNKTDAAVTTVGTTKSLVAMIKGILNRMPASGTIPTSAVASIQAGTIVVASAGSETSHTATITAVSARAYILDLGATYNNASTDPTFSKHRVELTNTTTVTAYRNAGGTGNLTVGYMVVDPG